MGERRGWIWLFPLSQALHAIEERLEGYGFHAWLRSRSHEPFSPQRTEMMHVAFVIGTLIRAWRHLDRRQFWIGCAAGALVQIPITWLAVAAH